jgi:hypothetical protein
MPLALHLVSLSICKLPSGKQDVRLTSLLLKPTPRIPLKASMQTPPPRAEQTVAMVASLLLLSIMEAVRHMTPLPAAQLAIRDTTPKGVTSLAAYCILLTHEMPLSLERGGNAIPPSL